MTKKFLTFILILSVVTPFFYLPHQAKKADALFGIGDLNLESIPQILQYLYEKIGRQVAQKMIDDMVRSTVNWAQSGFDGNPAYVTNPKQYFTDLADGIAGDFIAGSDLNFLCSPFQTQIRLALQKQYLQRRQFQCTLTDAVANIDAFYNDFDQGGWDAWFSMTQNSSNNPYGAFLDAQVELDSRIASAAHLKREQLNWNSGFLSFEKCLGTEVLNNETGTKDCIGAKQVVTPGQTIKTQLDKALGSGLEKLISAQSIDQLISAFASGLLNRYVFGSQGLFASGSSGSSKSSKLGTNTSSRASAIDVDGDRIPDGYDADRDNLLESNNDICYHGGNPAVGCVVSSAVVSSPYFVPVCQAINLSLFALQDFETFINTHANQLESDGENFKNKADAELWANRASEVNSSVEAVLAAIQNYRAPYFDEIEIGTNRLANYIGKVVDSLAGDGNDLDLAKIGNGGGGIDNLKKYVTDNISFFQDIKNKFGDCGRPNIRAVDNVVVPEEPPPEVTLEELEENNICATPEEVEQFLINNPGDEGRIPEAFPCTTEELEENNICATPEEIERFLIDNPGDEGRLDEAFPCTQ
ncbi:MAG: hypothetical protein HYT69_01300 [Candidatus Zambryskibacteria bacterium]|nr:hypothetical protein [Candidatus Zambryskibacteria bacterium]